MVLENLSEAEMTKGVIVVRNRGKLSTNCTVRNTARKLYARKNLKILNDHFWNYLQNHDYFGKFPNF